MNTSMTCVEYTTEILNGKLIYIAVFNYQNYLGLNSFTMSSTTPLKYTVGGTYTAVVS